MPSFTWDKTQRAIETSVPDFRVQNPEPVNPLGPDTKELDYSSKFIKQNMLPLWCGYTNPNTEHKQASGPV